MKFIVVIFCLWPSIALAGGRGGHNTTFDPNSYGGGWTCFRSQVSGACGSGPFFQYLNAACDGTTDDTAALAAWITYAHGLGGALAKINTGIGSRCHLPLNASFAADNTINCAGFGSSLNTTVQNLIVWQYGSTFDAAWFGGGGFYSVQNPNGVQTGCSGAPTNTSPLIQAANAGDTTVTLITAAESSNFVVGDWIVVTALGNGKIGDFPPSHFFHEHRLITAVNAGTGVLTLDSPLQFSYKTTYPNIGGGAPFQGGPATVYLMEKTYNTNAQYFGGTITSASQTNIVGKSIVLTDVAWSSAAAGPNPTQSGAIWLIGNSFLGSEVDKDIDLLAIINSSNHQIDIQSSSINTFIMQGTTITGTLNGTPANSSISNSKIGGIRAGPPVSGISNSTTLDGVTFTTAVVGVHFSLISSYSLSTGTLTIAKASSEWTSGVAAGLWVPGKKYFIGAAGGFNACTPSVTFTVSDVVDAGSNVQVVTDIASIPAGNICNGNNQPVATFAAYQSQSLVQKFSGPGNLLSNPEMLPP